VKTSEMMNLADYFTFFIYALAFWALWSDADFASRQRSVNHNFARRLRCFLIIWFVSLTLGSNSFGQKKVENRTSPWRHDGRVADSNSCRLCAYLPSLRLKKGRRSGLKEIVLVLFLLYLRKQSRWTMMMKGGAGYRYFERQRCGRLPFPLIPRHLLSAAKDSYW